MEYFIQKKIVIQEIEYHVGDIVTIHFLSGGGIGGCEIKKIGDKSISYTQGTGKEKTASYEKMERIEMQERRYRRSSGCYDISGQEIKEHDVIECHVGNGNVLAENLIICYGEYQAYCPVDRCYMKNVGFFASGKDLLDMPLGETEDYAKIVGNLIDNPELEPNMED